MLCLNVTAQFYSSLRMDGCPPHAEHKWLNLILASSSICISSAVWHGRKMHFFPIWLRAFDSLWRTTDKIGKLQISRVLVRASFWVGNQSSGPLKLLAIPTLPPFIQFAQLPDLSIRPASAARSHAVRWGCCTLRGSGVGQGGWFMVTPPPITKGVSLCLPASARRSLMSLCCEQRKEPYFLLTKDEVETEPLDRQ